MNKIEILYEDNHIIVVIKPPGILSQADSTKDMDMLTLVKEYIKERYQKKGNVYLGLVHRLDRMVSGIMVFAKTSKAASRLSLMIQNHQFKKEYIAVVHGNLIPKKGEMIDYLVKQETDFKTIVTDEKHGKLSKLYYEVESYLSKENLSLVKINLETGRHHQIRVQFASRKYFLYGDNRYGYREKENIALCAYRLEFMHPTKREIMKFTIPYPRVNPFIKFDL